MLAWDRILFRQYLESGEDMLFIAHKHWIELFNRALKAAVFGVLIPWTTWFFLPQLFWVSVAWTLVVWLWFLYHFIDWYFDVWIATTTSIIDVEWRGLFHRLSSRIPYSEVREVSYEIKGIIGLILRFGDASISMATSGQVTLNNIARPRFVTMRITELRDQYLSEQKVMQSDALQALLSDMVNHHVSDRGIRIKQS